MLWYYRRVDSIEGMTLIIYKQNLGRVQEKLEKLKRKAAKLDKAPLGYQVLPAPSVTIHVYDGPCMAPCFDMDHKRTYQQVEIVLTGEAPVIDGWKLLARVEHLAGSDQNLIHVVPGVEFDSTDYRARRVCDHCSINVRRNDTYLITDGSVVKQIGRNCLADYVRSPAFAEYVISLGSILRQARDMAEEEERDGRRYLEPEYKTVDVVAVAIAVVRDYGYQKKDSFNEPTVNRVSAHFLSDRDDKARVETTEQDKAQATAALAWLSEQPEESDYIRNVKLVCGQETTYRKHFGLVASLPATYRKALDLIQTTKDKPVSQHVGNIKDKISCVVRVDKIIAYETHFGFGDMVKMRDESGNLLVWFTSSLPRSQRSEKGQIIDPIQEGNIVDLRGTVKAHEEFRNEKQTILTRCKLNPKSMEAKMSA